MSTHIRTPLAALAGLLALSSAAWLPLPADAADIRFADVLPGGAMIGKNMVSMRERRYLNIVPQQTDFSCGAAAVATILKYAYGQDVTENAVIEGLLKVSDPEVVRVKGFSLLDIKNYIQTLGMRARGYKISPQTLESVRVPTIALIDMKGYKHFVVVNKTADGRVYIADPALGNRIVPKDQFVREWNGLVFAVIGKGFERDTVLLRPPLPLTAHGLVDTYRPLTDAELLDFGFSHADLF